MLEITSIIAPRTTRLLSTMCIHIKILLGISLLRNLVMGTYVDRGFLYAL